MKALKLSLVALMGIGFFSGGNSSNTLSKFPFRH